jgi:hypothetical protein
VQSEVSKTQSDLTKSVDEVKQAVDTPPAEKKPEEPKTA